MSVGAELPDLERRLELVENALADAQARVPGLRREVRDIREALGELARQRSRLPPPAGRPAANGAAARS
jgi:hypothetical protein